MTGGFRTEPLLMQFVAFDDLGKNIAVTTHGVLELYSADFFGAPLMHVPIVLAALSAAIIPLRHLLHHEIADRPVTPPRPLLVLLAFGAMVDLLALVLSNRIEIEGNPIAASRYLFPLRI